MDCTSSAAEQQAPLRHRPLVTVDVTVVGAGPAGVFLASLLARRGLRVVLVEKPGYHVSNPAAADSNCCCITAPLLQRAGTTHTSPHR